MIAVKQAAEGDREALTALIRNACQLAPSCVHAEGEAIGTFAASLVCDPARVCLVLRDGDTLGGCIALALTVNHYSGDLQAQKLGWYVEPAYAGHGLKLLRAAERWARARGAVCIIASSPAKRVSRVLTGLGYKPMEMIYRKDLSCHS
jgi:GNAT superfamily N-acetyltransferase